MLAHTRRGGFITEGEEFLEENTPISIEGKKTIGRYTREKKRTVRMILLLVPKSLPSSELQPQPEIKKNAIQRSFLFPYQSKI